MRLLFDKNTISEIPETSLKHHLLRYYDLFYEDDAGPVFVVAEIGDDITDPDYFFVGNRGLLSDLLPTFKPEYI